MRVNNANDDQKQGSDSRNARQCLANAATVKRGLTDACDALSAVQMLGGHHAVSNKAAHVAHICCLHALKWEFPKITGTLFWGPYNRDPTI